LAPTALHILRYEGKVYLEKRQNSSFKFKGFFFRGFASFFYFFTLLLKRGRELPRSQIFVPSSFSSLIKSLLCSYYIQMFFSTENKKNFVDFSSSSSNSSNTF
jgi:hypothetical protein